MLENWVTPSGFAYRTFSSQKVRQSPNIRLPSDGGSKPAVPIDASAYIILGYHAQDQEYFLVGLSGFDYAYLIGRFLPGRGWTAVAHAGSRANLIPDRDYQLRVRVQGQRVTLIVDGIRILEHVLHAPITNAQLGLSAWGNGGIRFTETSVRREIGKIFVVMQFSEPYEELYKDVIQPVSQNRGLEAYHAGEVFGPGVILNDIIRGIIDAKIVIAEITARNPNVFYELGFAHALDKPTILLAERGKELPFDVKGFRCLFYENSIGGKRKVEEALDRHLQAILRE